ncbi:hypothetical protein COLO4_36450 [Corchorus olitorius]|uniref:Uncharacterized protein n=1 Tax=Corchorus olitorius TaxID=93759 RepID=A0A1R3G8Y0_9ROSI|nr:hypothetical protein COLO4_36450 [Corchorus olitorius]
MCLLLLGSLVVEWKREEKTRVYPGRLRIYALFFCWMPLFILDLRVRTLIQWLSFGTDVALIACKILGAYAECIFL